MFYFETYCANQKADVEEILIEVLQLNVGEPGAVQSCEERGDTRPDCARENRGYIGSKSFACWRRGGIFRSDLTEFELSVAIVVVYPGQGCEVCRGQGCIGRARSCPSWCDGFLGFVSIGGG